MKIPKQFRILMTSKRPYNPDKDDVPAFETESQKEDRLLEQIKEDKKKGKDKK